MIELKSSQSASLATLAETSRTRPVWLRISRLIDGVSDLPKRDAHIVFDATQIHFVGTSGMTPSPKMLAPGQRTADATLTGWTIMPCLIEAHAHMFLDGAPVNFAEREQYLKQSPQVMLAHAHARWIKILQCGIGTIRDAGDKHHVGLTLATEAKAHQGKPGATPWIDSPGAAIHHKGRYGSFMGLPIEDHAGPAECVAARVKDGADRIKLLLSGIINFKVGQVTTPPQMPVEEVKALVAAAKSHGKQTFAHASGSEGVENSIEGGVTTVEHGFFIKDDQLARMRDRRIGWIPTFSPVQLQIDKATELGWNDEVVGHLKRIIDAHRTMIRKGHEMGVTILAGSDAGSCGVAHGIGFLEELVHMEKAGMPPMAVIRAATGASADMLKFAEPVGKIAPGSRSRFILMKHDPLATVANLHKDKTILFDGQAIECPAELDKAGL